MASRRNTSAELMRTELDLARSLLRLADTAMAAPADSERAACAIGNARTALEAARGLSFSANLAAKERASIERELADLESDCRWSVENNQRFRTFCRYPHLDGNLPEHPSRRLAFCSPPNMICDRAFFFRLFLSMYTDRVLRISYIDAPQRPAPGGH